MLRKLAIAVGIVAGTVGVIGLLPRTLGDSDAIASVVYGAFLISSEHSALYILTAVAAFVSTRYERWATWFFRIFGVIFGVMAILGFNNGADPMSSVNFGNSDDIAHLAISAGFLMLGFLAGDTSSDN